MLLINRQIASFESFKKNIKARAGLLTYPHFEQPSHIIKCSDYCRLCQNVA